MIVDLSEELSANNRSPLRSEVVRLLANGHRRILINLEDVLYVDSSGLGELLASKKVALIAGAELGLLRPQKSICGLLTETLMDRIFRCFDDEQAAIRSFSVCAGGL